MISKTPLTGYLAPDALPGQLALPVPKIDMQGALMSSKRTDWCTPASLLEAVYKFDRIGLDPCGSSPGRIVNAASYFVFPERDGLKERWSSSDGVVYCNPPYGRVIGDWVAKARLEYELHGVESIVLIPARTDTKYFQSSNAKAICFWKGRLTFLGAPAPAPFPSALLYYGYQEWRFKSVFRNYGMVLFPEMRVVK